MALPQPEYFESFDGERMAWRELGHGRPVVLLHGYFSNAEVNWLKYGHAERIAAKGFRVIMPDLRAHGDSAKPHDAAAYPPDALMRDGLALVAHLGLTDYDLADIRWARARRCVCWPTARARAGSCSAAWA